MERTYTLSSSSVAEIEQEAADVTKYLTARLSLVEKWSQEEEEDTVERGENEYGWALLPDLILEKIFELLPMSKRYAASLVCKQWSRAFYMQRTWNMFLFEDRTLTKAKYDYHSGWSYKLDHLRSQYFIMRVGRFVRKLVLSTMWNLFNLYEFMRMLSFYAEKYEENPEERESCLFRIHTLRFVFWCDTANREQHGVVNVYGTGGRILEGLKQLIENLKYLRSLELIDLMLHPDEAAHLLDDACMTLCDKLNYLTIINTTRFQFLILHPACFVNLCVLKISPNNLGDEMVEMLANIESFKQLHIVQNVYSTGAIPVNPKSWIVAEHKFKVFLRTTGEEDKEIVWQEKAPVFSILYDCPKTKVTSLSIMRAIELYSDTLQEYGHLGLSRFSSSRSFQKRIDTILLTLCRKCPYLSSLTIRDRISTSTALLIVSMSPNLRSFYVRKNCLILKCDFDFHNLDLDYNFTQWIKLNSRSYEKTSREISKIMGFMWKPLSDNDFKRMCSERPPY